MVFLFVSIQYNQSFLTLSYFTTCSSAENSMTHTVTTQQQQHTNSLHILYIHSLTFNGFTASTSSPQFPELYDILKVSSMRMQIGLCP